MTRHYVLNGRPIATRGEDGLYYLHSDHLGSTTLLTDAQGNEAGRVHYSPYGSIISSTLTVTATDRLFTGQRHEPSTGGLYDYRARFYDPLTGSFIQPDSIVPELDNPAAWNRYAYVYGNPVNFTDPSGNCPEFICVQIETGLVGKSYLATPYRRFDPYSDWNVGRYSGCFMCHAAVANGQIILTNEKLAAVDYQMRQTGLSVGENAVRLFEPIDYIATAIDCSNDCDPNVIALTMMPFVSGGMADEFARLVPARNIRFTQDTISPSTTGKNAMFLDDLIGSMADYGWKGSPLNVVEINGVLYSLDHRRLVAAKLLGIDVPINIVDLSNPKIAAEFGRKSTGLRAGTQGLYIDVKGTNIRIDMSGNIMFTD